MNKQELQLKANEVRKGIVTAVHAAKAGHPGGSLSAADIFTYLYFEELNIDPKDPKKPDRDRFVLSKGHTAPGLYSALALRGYFPVEDLKTLRHLGSYLQGHPDMKHIPGVDMSSGSLGQGISAAVGMALSAKLSGDDDRVLLSRMRRHTRNSCPAARTYCALFLLPSDCCVYRCLLRLVYAVPDHRKSIPRTFCHRDALS